MPVTTRAEKGKAAAVLEDSPLTVGSLLNAQVSHVISLGMLYKDFDYFITLHF